ncbi:MAG: hypothetical protein GXO98_00240, partial [Nitrospirae bacterium]|nr:hypothetical protein [Nitrospirota bacterium]
MKNKGREFVCVYSFLIAIRRDELREKIVAGLKESLRVQEDILKGQVEIIVRMTEAIVASLEKGGKV